MSKFDLTIKELGDVKAEINSFAESEFNDLKVLDKNNLIFILKKIVFLKYLSRQVNSDYRFHALTSDFMYLIRSIKTGEERYYYLNLRSIIEHSLRIVNSIESTNTISNSDIMNSTQTVIEVKKASINMSIIKDEYTRSCLYVHGNENAGMSLATFYQNCMEDEGLIDEISVKLNVLVKMLKELFELILISQNAIIDAAFFRRKTILEYLVGKNSYLVFEKYKVE
ncbi:hypothetical protein P9D28_22245 [Bacillus haynesii]|uniref:hypothetical protein n=1 Tax=Bacillus haynesii TaxID=1925021 RepID=UPI002DBB5E6E|nr:hypothetical protein [Bacillus haynesii]MEC1555126.1 hypothetical protein [Bacillus haynesii]